MKKNVIFSSFATAPQLDLFTQRVNKFARQESNITPEFIEDLPTGAILTAESRIINQSVIAGNSASVSGGGIINFGGPVTFFNSIVAGNTPDSYFGSNPTLLGTNFLNGNPLLAPLGNYGGPTQTMPPLPGSPAIDAGDDSATNTFASDQLGLPRLSGMHVDIGAAELQVVIAHQPAVLTDVRRLGDGAVQFGFTNLIGASFTVFAGADVAAPFNTWSNLGPAVEMPAGSGQFQFTDPQATNNGQRFYRVRSP